MSRLAFFAFLLLLPGAARPDAVAPKRLVILKVDGLNADLLDAAMRTVNPATGKSQLPWISHIFAANGSIFDNFYTRGISLSAPSWSILDTGRHTIIRGNVEYDRYTGQVYDYLNFFPFYLGYARLKQVDMPGVSVLDRAGIPLLIDGFSYPQTLQSFQLFQRGVRWLTLKNALQRRFSAESIVSMLESGDAPSYDEVLGRQIESELLQGIAGSSVLYLDLFTGRLDHDAHATSQPAALLNELKSIDALAGRMWTALQQSPLAKETVFVMVSDHGMNNVPGIISQTFSLPDLLNSPEGGSHHVVTNRHPLSDFKIKGLDPMVHRVVTPSVSSFYLEGDASRYPTAWLDIDGNERASVHFRNNDFNKLHILLQQLQRSDISEPVRQAAVSTVLKIISHRRRSWEALLADMTGEMTALEQAIAARQAVLAQQPKRFTREQHDLGENKVTLRLRTELSDWQTELFDYRGYMAHLRALLALDPDAQRPIEQRIEDLIPPMSLGDNNSVADIQHYVVGPSPAGLILDPNGNLDLERSFRFVDYPALFLRQRAHNLPQKELPPQPIDFAAMRLPDPDESHHAYWLYRSAANQLVIATDAAGRISVMPVQELTQDAEAKISWKPQSWMPGLPLQLFEDPDLHIPAGFDRQSWLASPHTEREWLEAIHSCRYSNGVIGIIEELSPISVDVPGPAGISPTLLRYERRRRELVQADLHLFTADHWNFNTRFPNPGGNHGSFFRISTHSVWMMAGPGIPTRRIEQPYDSLNFASTLLHYLGREAPMPDRVVSLDAAP
ncbi:MAG TPA: alkaline phosphatase family protein [Bryobacteraceae bacterium]|nr:alkaline phosphatase family protein [Bryobacteraceae bacterium]